MPCVSCRFRFSCPPALAPCHVATIEPGQSEAQDLCSAPHIRRDSNTPLPLHQDKAKQLTPWCAPRKSLQLTIPRKNRGNRHFTKRVQLAINSVMLALPPVPCPFALCLLSFRARPRMTQLCWCSTPYRPLRFAASWPLILT